MSNFSVGDCVRINGEKLKSILTNDLKEERHSDKRCQKLWDLFLSHPFASYQIVEVDTKNGIKINVNDLSLNNIFYSESWFLRESETFAHMLPKSSSKDWYFIKYTGEKNGVLITELKEWEVDKIEKMLNDGFKSENICFKLNRTKYDSYADAHDAAILLK